MTTFAPCLTSNKIDYITVHGYQIRCDNSLASKEYISKLLEMSRDYMKLWIDFSYQFGSFQSWERTLEHFKEFQEHMRKVGSTQNYHIIKDL